MAKEKDEIVMEQEPAKATYTEEMSARVNKEGDHHEVILTGTRSSNTLVLRNQPGAKGFKDGAMYALTFTEVE